jgi:hypothetical protein
MSHIPLLAQKTVPKLQPPRRAPQVVCLCLLLGIVFLLVPSSAYTPLLSNATRASTDPPPAAVQRIIEASTQQHRLMMLGNPEETLQDLVTTVSFLAKREIASR